MLLPIESIKKSKKMCSKHKQNYSTVTLRIKMIVLSVSLTLLYFHSAYSQAGSLDVGFDTDGIVTTSIGAGYEGTYKILIQPDGKIISAGYSDAGVSGGGANWDFALVRYNANGSLDTTFGGDGKVTTDLNSYDDTGTWVSLQSDGKIVVCGSTYISTTGDDICAVIRYNSDGSLDSSFNMDGIFTYVAGNYDNYMLVNAIQPDGKILVAGYSYSGTMHEFIVLRLDSSGYLDISFGTNGLAYVPFGNEFAYCFDMVVLPNGKILTLGRIFNYNGAFTSDFALAQLNSNGTIDNTFGISGKVVTDFAGLNDWGTCLAIQSDGKIIAAGYTGDISAITNFAMIRYDSTGTIDSTFGINGKVTTSISNNDRCYAITLQKNSKILLAGTSYNGSQGFALVRYTNTGEIDSTFDIDGKVVVQISNNNDVAFSMALQQDGKIVLGGRALPTTDDDFALIRLNNDSVFNCILPVTFNSLPDTVCQSSSSINLTGVPPGGVFTGPGIAGSVFYPANAGMGSHQVIYSYYDSLGCGADTAIIFVSLCTSINNLNEQSAFVIYPNPSNEILLINAEEKIEYIALTDLTGKAIFSQGNINERNYFMNTIGYQNGIYFLQLQCEKSIHTAKIIIQH